MATLGLQGFTGADASAFAGARESMAQGMAQLGAQIRQDIAKIALQRDVKAMGQDLASVDPHSEDFAQQAIGVLSQHPLAAQTPFGSAAINQLGAQHKAWINAQNKVNEVRPLPGYPGYGVDRTGSVTKFDVPPLPEKTDLIKTPQGVARVGQQTGKPVWQIGDPFKEGQKYKETKVGNDIVRTYEDGTSEVVYQGQGKTSSRGPTLSEDIKYSQFEPKVRALRDIKERLQQAGLSPEASHEEIVKKLGQEGAYLSAQRHEIQKGLRSGREDDTGSKSVPAAEAFVDSYNRRYNTPVSQVGAGMIPGLPQASAPAAPSIPGLPIGSPVPMGEPPSLMEGGGIPDNRPSYKPGSIYKDSNGRRARFTKDGTWEPIQ